MSAPLRKIVDTYRNQAGSEIERLECGHELHTKHDIYGPTSPNRRRCKACLRKADSADGGERRD